MTNGHHPSSGICSSSSTSESTPVPPKKPINPYLLFCQLNRSTIQEQLHNENKTDQASKQELTKALATKWKVLTMEEKDVYYKLYEAEKEKYDKALNASHSQPVMNTNTPTAPSNTSTKFSKSLAPLTHTSTFSSPVATVSKVNSSPFIINISIIIHLYR